MFIALDLETTGFSPEKDKIIEFGAIKFDLDYFKNPDKKETLQILINPGIQIPQITTHITNIKNEDLKNAPSFEEKKQEITKFIGNLPIIGHNIQFDTNFLRNNGIELQNTEYDTYNLSSVIFPNLNSYSLEFFSKKFNLFHENKHRALDDAIASAELFIKIIKEFENLNPKLIKEIQNLAQKSNWNFKNILSNLNIPQNSKPTPITENTPQKITQKSPNPITEKILTTDTPFIFEINPPYENLIKELTFKSNQTTYIALPQTLFPKLEKEIPNNIAKIDLPQNYISPENLKKFKEKEFFEDYEISALIKYLIWLEKTETGLLKEIKLIEKEYSTLNKVNIRTSEIQKDPSLISKEPFLKQATSKEQKHPTICTHEYILQNPLNNNFNNSNSNIIIFNLENFYKTFYSQNSHSLKLNFLEQNLSDLKELEPENKTIETLLSRCTILFGIIGIIFEKFNNKDSYNAICEISEELLNTKEWQNSKEIVNNLLELSIELGEIKTQKTAPFLEKWKENLESLDSIFRNLNLNKNLIWIEKDFNENLTLKKTPLEIKQEITNFLNQFKNYIFIGNSLNLKDEGIFTKTKYDLPENTKFQSLIKTSNNLEILITEDSIEKDKNQIPDFIKNYFEKTKEPIAVICNSKKRLEELTIKLSTQKIPILSQTTNSLQKLEDQFSENPISIILITPFSWEKFEQKNQIKTLFIDKIPFDPPSLPFLMAKSRNYKDPFNELQIPQAILSLKRILSYFKTKNTQERDKKIIILDSRLQTKYYGKAFLENLKEITPYLETNSLNSI